MDISFLAKYYGFVWRNSADIFSRNVKRLEANLWGSLSLVIPCSTLISLYFALFGLVVTDFRLIDDGLELELSSAIVFCTTEEPAAASLICCCCCC